MSQARKQMESSVRIVNGKGRENERSSLNYCLGDNASLVGGGRGGDILSSEIDVQKSH